MNGAIQCVCPCAFAHALAFPLPQQLRRRLSVRWAPDVPSVAPINSANAVVAVLVVLGLGGVDVPAIPSLSTHGWKAFGRAKVSFKYMYIGITEQVVKRSLCVCLPPVDIILVVDGFGTWYFL